MQEAVVTGTIMVPIIALALKMVHMLITSLNTTSTRDNDLWDRHQMDFDELKAELIALEQMLTEARLEIDKLREALTEARIELAKYRSEQ